MTTSGIDAVIDGDPQVLHDGDDAVVTAEFAGDGHQTGCAAGDQGQRAGEGVDVAVQPQQGAGDDAQQQRGDAHADDHRPVRAERPQRVAVHHRADVDPEHALGRQTRRTRHGRGGERAMASTTPTSSAANRAADGTPSRSSGTVTPTVDQNQQRSTRI